MQSPDRDESKGFNQFFNLSPSGFKNRLQSKFDSAVDKYGSEQIALLMEQARYFEIDGRKFEFEDEDEVFSREGPCESRNLQNGHSACLCCESKFKSAKSAHYWLVHCNAK